MSNPPPELLARAKAAADAFLAQPERAHWGEEEREAGAREFVAAYVAAFAAEHRRWADLVAHPAFTTNRDEVLALGRTDASVVDLRPVLDGLQLSGGIAGRA